MRIKNKREMVELLESGALGNATRIWHDPKELLASGFKGPISVRSSVSWGKFKPEMSTIDCIAYYRELIRLGARSSSLFFHEWAPPESMVVICHLGRTEYGYELLWSRNKNIAIDTQIVHGLVAKITLEELAGEHNREKLQEIFDIYPESAIEFTIHNQRVGRSHEDMVIWEVRDY